MSLGTGASINLFHHANGSRLVATRLDLEGQGSCKLRTSKAQLTGQGIIAEIARFARGLRNIHRDREEDPKGITPPGELAWGPPLQELSCGDPAPVQAWGLPEQLPADWTPYQQQHWRLETKEGRTPSFGLAWQPAAFPPALLPLLLPVPETRALQPPAAAAAASPLLLLLLQMGQFLWQTQVLVQVLAAALPSQ